MRYGMLIIVILLNLKLNTVYAAAQKPDDLSFRTNTAAFNCFAEQSGIILITVPGDVQRGDTANIEIQGQSGISYSAEISYKVKREKVTQLKTAVAPKSGLVTWNFNIDKDTLPGVYTIEISGGGQELKLRYRVVE